MRHYVNSLDYIVGSGGGSHRMLTRQVLRSTLYLSNCSAKSGTNTRLALIRVTCKHLRLFNQRIFKDNC